MCYVRLDKKGGDVGNGFFRRIGRCEAETLDGFTRCGCGYGTDCIDVFAEMSHTGIDVYTNAMTQYEVGLRRPGVKRVFDPPWRPRPTPLGNRDPNFPSGIAM